MSSLGAPRILEPQPAGGVRTHGAEGRHATSLPGLVAWTLGAGALALAAALALGRPPLDLYDVSFSLDWGSDVVHGLMPDVRVAGASTPHPLSIVTGAVAALFGSSALDVVRALVLGAAGVGVTALYRIGVLASSRAVGLVAVAVLVCSEPFVYATVGQATPSDLPSLAAVLAALACELARPRRGLAPLVLLSVAGLWRPEPWLMAGLYWLWATRGQPRGRRAALGAIALSAPVVWMAGDLAMTHNALYSLVYTHESTLAGRRPTGLAHVPGTLWQTLVRFLGAPALAAALAGVALELFVRRLPRVLLALLALSALSFAAIGAAHLALGERYVFPIAVLLAVFCAQLIAGWWKLPRSRLRTAWMLAALVAAGFIVAGAPHQIRALAGDRAAFHRQARAVSELAHLTHTPQVRAALRTCGPVAASWRVVPVLAYDIGERPRTLTTQDGGLPAAGVIVLPNSALTAGLFETHRFTSASLQRHGWHPLASNASWKVWTRCTAPGAHA